MTAKELDDIFQNLRGRKSYNQVQFYNMSMIAIELLRWAEKPWWRRGKRPL